MRLGVEAAIVEGELLPGDVEVADGRIVSVGLEPKRGGGIAAPGFVDLQVNGYGGVDFAAADAAGYRTAGEALLEGGVTAYQPTLITAPEQDLIAALQEVPAIEQTGPRILGVHLEGPFLSPHRLGAHPSASRRDPDPALLERLLAAGPVAYVTLAPELPGALELIDLLQDRGVVVSCGHSDATAAQAGAAFDRGVGTVTHLFNAMRPLGHRDPGIAGAALARDDVIVQVILDGHHLAAETAKVVWRTASGRMALVTDAIAAAGTGDDSCRLGGVEVEIRDGVARRADGVIAGSVVTMIQAVRNLHALGAPLVDAVAAATSVPARAARRPGLGVLRPGGDADVVVLDDRLEIRMVLRAGAGAVGGMSGDGADG
jgi:N-acetylglucosamine-6-phosphate deacetylase